MSSRTTPKKTIDEGNDNVPVTKGKGKAVEEAHEPEDVEMDDDDDDDEEEEEEEEGEEAEEEEEDYDEITPENIVSGGRRTRGKRVDYTSKEALEKAGLKDADDEEEDGDVKL